MRECSHICTLISGAQMLYQAWHRKTMQLPVDGTRGDAWPERVATTCFKLSMIFHAMHDPETPQIREVDMHHACEMASLLIQELRRLMDSELAFTPVEKDLQMLRRILEKYGDEEGWVAHSTVLKYSHLDARRFHELIVTAQQSEILETGRAKRGHPPLRLVGREAGEDDR